MTTPRVIPCLLLDGESLVKTTRFANPVYIGDPINVISIFSSLAADELLLLDISATREENGPRFDLLERVAEECFVPLSYGGGLATAEQVGRVIEIGFEKVVLNTSTALHPELLAETATRFGRQALVASIDARRHPDGTYDVAVRGGTEPLGIDPVTHAQTVLDLGAGEILLTAIDRDGTMSGYDLDLTAAVSSAVSIPVIACGGAGTRADLAAPVHQAGASAVGAGSLFVFKGRERGVLINYPSRAQLDHIFQTSGGVR